MRKVRKASQSFASFNEFFVTGLILVKSAPLFLFDAGVSTKIKTRDPEVSNKITVF